MVNPIPEGTHTVTPYLVVRGADRAIDFYKRALGAVEVARMQGPDGSIMHAELRIGDSPVYLGEESPAMGALSPLSLGGAGVSIHLYVVDADAVFESAVREGATVRTPIADAFWGDRYGAVTDPFGHVWGIATHKEDLTPEQMDARAREAFASMPPPPDPLPEPEVPAPAAAPVGEESVAPARKTPPVRPAAKKKPAARKKVARKKAAKKKPARKKVAKKKVAKKKTVRGKTAKKKAVRKAKKKPARRKVVKKKAAKKGARRSARKATRKKAAKKKPARKGAKKRTAKSRASRRHP